MYIISGISNQEFIIAHLDVHVPFTSPTSGFLPAGYKVEKLQIIHCFAWVGISSFIPYLFGKENCMCRGRKELKSNDSKHLVTTKSYLAKS